MITIPLSNIEKYDYIYKDIYNWYHSNGTPILNIVTLPYNSSLIFIPLLTELLNLRKKILYITGNGEKDIEVLNHIKSEKKIKSYSYLKNINSSIKSDMVFINQENALKINESFDLMIYDDICSYTAYSRIEIQEQLNYLFKFTKKLITFSIEPIFHNSKILEVPLLKGSYPMREPRFLTTRVDLNKEIPYMMYDYLKWFIEEKRKVIIYTPNHRVLEQVYKYLLSLKESLSTIIQRFEGNGSDKNIRYLLKARDSSLIVLTNDFYDYFNDISNLDVILFGGDNIVFDYKKIVYFCGRVALCNKENKGEVLIFASDVSLDMEKAKNITRRFNKLAWERGYIT